MGLSDLFKPRWRHSDYRVRVKQAEALKDPAILAQIALRDESGDVRLTALSKLSDQMVIAQIASSDPKPNNRMYALKRLHDRGCLTQVMNDQRGSLDVRLAAAIKLGDTASAQTLCTQLALSLGAPTGTSDLVRDIIADEVSLIQVATYAKASDIRTAAVRKMRNQNALKVIALNDPDDAVRRVAVAHIIDQNILCEVLLFARADDWWVRKDAPEKLTDQVLITKLVENIVNRTGVVLPEILIAKCADKDLLERCARSNSAGVRAAAVAQIDNQKLLAEIARTDPECGVRAAAVAKIDDQALVAEIAIVDESFFVRDTAIKNLTDPAFSSQTDQEMLTGLATQSNNLVGVRVRAVERLTNQALLAEVAKADESLDVRLAAIKNLTDQVALAAIARSDAHCTLHWDAISRLTDQGILAELARNCTERSLRVHAVKWMTDKILLADLANSGPEGRNEEVVKEVHLGGDEFRDRTTLEFVRDARETARGRLAELERRRHNKS